MNKKQETRNKGGDKLSDESKETPGSRFLYLSTNFKYFYSLFDERICKVFFVDNINCQRVTCFPYPRKFRQELHFHSFEIRQTTS